MSANETDELLEDPKMAFGSLTNHLMVGSKQVDPKVGMGATICCWSDRHAATIIKVTECQIHVQEDIATRTDSNGMSESQTYDYSPNADGTVIVFRKTKRGYRSKCGNGLLIGTRRHYYDYSF